MTADPKKVAYVNDEGKLVVDMAEAEKLWNSLDEKQQYQAMCAMFDTLSRIALSLDGD